MLEHMDYKKWKSLPLNKPKRGAPENKVKGACQDWLDLHKIMWNRQQSGIVQVLHPITKKVYWLHLAKKGSGDIVGSTKKGRYYEVETKSATGRQSPEQKARQEEVEANGGIYILARSVDDLKALL